MMIIIKRNYRIFNAHCDKIKATNKLSKKNNFKMDIENKKFKKWRWNINRDLIWGFRLILIFPFLIMLIGNGLELNMIELQPQGNHTSLLF